MKPYQYAERAEYLLLKEKAREMRHNPTEAESALWGMLRNRQLGYKFHRQYVVETYIVDFVCLEKLLVIELDGKYHTVPEQIEWDKARENRLRQLGFRILRITNEELFVTTEAAIEKIKEELSK
ncbi:MAG: endonuclease domain-containing protein [Paludibacteraceae bacterium]